MIRLRKLLLFILLTAAMVAWADDIHIVIDDPLSWSGDQLSPYVNQTVIFDSPFYVCSNEQSSTMTIAPRRIFEATNQVDPPSRSQASYEAYYAYLAQDAKATVTLTAASGYPTPLRSGIRILGLKARVTSTSSLQWISGQWVGNTRKDIENFNIDSAVDMRGKHTLLVCGFNIENYRLSQSNHSRQRTKVSKALAKIRADIFGLVEVGGGASAMQEIVNDLKTNTGFPYTFINDASSDGTLQKSGYVYRTDKVRPMGDLQNNDVSVSDRKKMQAFEELASGEIFIYAINHFKAKTGSATGADADQGDGQGVFNESRKAEARSVIAEYASERSYVSDPDILIMGDLNAYGKEDPIAYLTKNGMTDLHRYFHADTSYSYIYTQPKAGYLDHALCNATLLPQVTGMCALHINSDENRGYTYSSSTDLTMFRCSDHDPVIVGLNLDPDASIPQPTVQNVQNSVAIARNGEKIRLYNFNLSGEPAYYKLYDANGDLYAEGKISADDNQIQATPDQPGIYFLLVNFNNKAKAQGSVYRQKIIIY